MKQKILYRHSVGLLAILLFLMGAFLIFSIRESRENDSMPILLASQLKLQRLDTYPETKSLTDGEPCSSNDKVEAFILAVSQKDTKREDISCLMFGMGDSYKLYVIGFPSLMEGQRLVLVGDKFIQEAVAYQAGYPGNHVEEFKGDGQRLIFKYTGWNNPEKVIELTPKQ